MSERDRDDRPTREPMRPRRGVAKMRRAASYRPRRRPHTPDRFHRLTRP